jgi:hypothetical protein
LRDRIRRDQEVSALQRNRDPKRRSARAGNRYRFIVEVVSHQFEGSLNSSSPRDPRNREKQLPVATSRIKDPQSCPSSEIPQQSIRKEVREHFRCVVASVPLADGSSVYIGGHTFPIVLR